MSDTVIKVENLSKSYIIGHQSSEKYMALRDVIAARTKAAAKRLLHPFKSSEGGLLTADETEEFFALKDVSFEIKQGDRVGIIGRNGAGKSTLLKVLSRITEPTSGRIEIDGRVASLLEVGTGFHPELTGRENIFLNGAILGMSRVDIKRKFDEIVAFAEVERFLDTPVKRYSSGMYVRLAFAVAAHLEPEILIVDEVLAVGDAQFQKKCLGKMEEVGKEGRTVLFVSHNMGAISTLCSKAILLSGGELVNLGETRDIINLYMESGADVGGEICWNDLQSAPGSDIAKLRAVRIISKGKTTSDVEISDSVEVQMDFWNLKEGAILSTSIHLYEQTGVAVLASANFPSACLQDDGWFGKPYPRGLYRATCTIPGNFLNEGMYRINAIVLSDTSRLEAQVNDAVTINVHENGTMRKEYLGGWLGVVRPKLDWKTEVLDQKIVAL